MGSPSPLDVYQDLAVAQMGGQLDPSASEGAAARNMRRRIAAVLSIPGMAAAAALAAWSAWHVVVGIAAFAFLFAVLWLYAERSSRVLALIRRHKS
jgi:hypothetical protein